MAWRELRNGKLIQVCDACDGEKLHPRTVKQRIRASKRVGNDLIIGEIKKEAWIPCPSDFHKPTRIILPRG